MQDASLQGVPESRKLVALVIGNTIYGNSISVKRNLKAYLCEMGLPFLLPNTSAFLLQKIFQSVCGFRTHRSGWILKWRIAHLYQICKDFFIQAELVPAFRQMHESMSK